jgi:chromosome partitioning protein
MDDVTPRVPGDPPDAHRNRTPWQTVGGRVISLVSRKGGVGKTTSAVNLGAALALSGHTVLVVGTDPQCGVCRTLGHAPRDLPHGLDDLFGGVPLPELVLPSPLPDLHFVSPQVLTLADEEAFLANLARHAGTFVAEIDRARSLYDTILIDCPPNLGDPTRAALLASDSYLVPVQAEELSRDSVAALLEFVDTFRERTQPGVAPGDPGGLALEGLFLTMSSARTRMSRHVGARLIEDFGDLVFETVVPRATRLSEMALRGRPAVIYDRRSAGSRAYFDLADELVSRYCSETGPDDSLIEALLESMTRSLDAPSPAVAAAGDPDPESRPTYEEPSVPEMVSLDELLAEEEGGGRGGDDDWEDGYWSEDFGGNDRLN